VLNMAGWESGKKRYAKLLTSVQSGGLKEAEKYITGGL